MKKYAVLTREPRCFLGSFDFSWEQRKLGDIGKARSGVGFPDAEQGGVTGIPFFKVSDMNLDGNENEMTVANNYVTAEQIAVHRWSPITELPAMLSSTSAKPRWIFTTSSREQFLMLLMRA